ncbi:hypothetical protein SAMN00790413_04077 [Deinococcus hopiensis KR-140]|uniref:Uncharacterized protein n=1 Tax=Deinococcus hopiensis KR-140 TaxID=695939 RepID=A0A1W1UNJ6_9DEIO|nr:hypothetical protein SAMN00790413_04077 [Deinococcus hopiensis KR-140]
METHRPAHTRGSGGRAHLQPVGSVATASPEGTSPRARFGRSTCSRRSLCWIPSCPAGPQYGPVARCWRRQRRGTSFGAQSPRQAGVQLLQGRSEDARRCFAARHQRNGRFSRCASPWRTRALGPRSSPVPDGLRSVQTRVDGGAGNPGDQAPAAHRRLHASAAGPGFGSRCKSPPSRVSVQRRGGSCCWPRSSGTARCGHLGSAAVTACGPQRLFKGDVGADAPRCHRTPRPSTPLRGGVAAPLSRRVTAASLPAA